MDAALLEIILFAKQPLSKDTVMIYSYMLVVMDMELYVMVTYS